MSKVQLEDANGEVAVEDTPEKIKKYILDLTNDTVKNFMYYDRKGDEEYKVGVIDDAINKGIVTTDEIIEEFAKALQEHLR